MVFERCAMHIYRYRPNGFSPQRLIFLILLFTISTFEDSNVMTGGDGFFGDGG